MASSLSFAGRVALVTGAGSGLGRSYALELARRGCKVVVNDYGGVSTGNAAGTTTVSLDKAQTVVETIRAAGGEAIANGASVSDYEGMKGAVQQALDTWGRIDIAIHNAGIYRDRRMENLTEMDYDLTLAVHVKGAFNVVRHCWGPMVNQKYGRIVLTSSGGAFGGPGNYLLYGTAKSAMIGMAKNLKDNGLPYNVLVNVLMPGAATAMIMNDPTGTMISPKMKESFEKNAPPELVMPATLYMCHEVCKDTGETIAAEMGNFGRVALVKGAKGGPKSVEWVRDNWDTIMALDENGNQDIKSAAGFIEMGPGGRKPEGLPFGRRPVKPPKVVTKDGVDRGSK